MLPKIIEADTKNKPEKQTTKESKVEYYDEEYASYESEEEKS
jgi:hypothetical protein